MCIIAIKKNGVEMPNEDTIKNMYFSNPDGAGFMYHDKHKNLVVIKKGYMTLKSFLTDINKIKDIKNTSLIMHFRITTHGGTKPENCHPFPISENIGMLQKLDVKAKIGVVHNGIISSVIPNKNESDTMCYIREQLAPLSKALPNFYESEHALQMVKNAIDSKMAFLTHDGKIITIGEFIEKDGVLYSNRSFEAWVSTFTKLKKNTSISSSKYSYDDHIAYEEDDYYGEIVVSEHPLLDAIVVDAEGVPIYDLEEVFVDHRGNLYYYDYNEDMLLDLRTYDYSLIGASPSFDEENAFLMCTEMY